MRKDRSKIDKQKMAARKRGKCCNHSNLDYRYFLNKVVVVTGASSGIGRCLSYWYLNNGAKVALVGRDILELE